MFYAKFNFCNFAVTTIPQVWNSELEIIAQRWADQCTFAHDSQRKKLDGSSVGQNVYWGCKSWKETEASVQAGMEKTARDWYNEVTDPGFDSHSINPYKYVHVVATRYRGGVINLPRQKYGLKRATPQ